MTRHSIADRGQWGEDLVRQWLEIQGAKILHQRWTCRWGELDLIALLADGTIAFVEVKTRSAGNWDSDGGLALSASKRAKLWKTAELWLVKYPQLADRPCRFDVALVKYQTRAPAESHLTVSKTVNPVKLAGLQAVSADRPFSRQLGGNWFSLNNYIADAFSLS
jgi:putative endonuclease